MTNAETQSEPTPEEARERFFIEQAKTELLDQVLQGQITLLEYNEGIEELNRLTPSDQHDEQ